MKYLNDLFILLIFSLIFTNSATAQEKPSESLTTTIDISDKVNSETKRFESKTGNFSINISQNPTQVRNIETKKMKDTGKQFYWQFEKTVYTVMYSKQFDSKGKEISREMSRKPVYIEEANGGIRTGILRSGGKLISEKEIFYGKYKGREFRALIPNGKSIVRMYIVNGTDYLLTAAYTDEKDEAEILRVLNSFELLTENK
jgi:hypothetical protein